MKPDQALERRLLKLGGARLTKEESAQLRSSLQGIPGWLLDFLATYPVGGASFTLSKKKDRSGLGVDMKWPVLHDMIEEATEYFLGIPALAMGYVPIGMCQEGSGDPYFISIRKGDNPPVVRIPHDAVVDDTQVDEAQIELVAPSLEEFLSLAAAD